MNKLNSSTNQTSINYKEYLDKINQYLEKIKEAYADPLDGVLTYEKGICTTFFGKKEKSIGLEDIQKKEQEIKDIINIISTIKSNLDREENFSSSLKKIYIESLNSLIKKFSMFQNAVWIEGEKSGYKLTADEREKYSKQIFSLQKEIYGEPVSENKEETNSILQRLHNLYEKNQEKLNDNEKSIFLKFLEECDGKYNFNYIKEENKSEEPKEEKQIETKNINKEKLKEISRNVIDFYKNHFGENNTNLENRNVVEKSGINSLNVSGMNQEFRIPETYENIGEKKIIQTVISHEIEQHLLGWDNTNRILGKGFASSGYDFISEGVAKINEDIALGKINSIEDLKKMKEKPKIGIIGVFICENYNYEDAVKIITIYNKLTSQDDEEKCKKKAIDIAKRRKRFVPYDLPGSSIKDTLYERGKNRVIDYLTEDGSLESAIKKYKDLNTFKFGPQELRYIEEIKKELKIDNKKLSYTLFIGRILHDKLNKGKGSAKEYTKETNLTYKDITFSSKRELIKILNLIKDKKDSSNQQIEKT